jgi:hypothetical protein
MKIPTPIKVLVIIGIISWSCFETLQFFNRQSALKTGNHFLKTHNSTVKSINCYVPADNALFQSPEICTFSATQKQIQVLVKNLSFRQINPILLSENELDRLRAEAYTQREAKGVVEPGIKTKLNDKIRSSRVEENSCWAALGLKDRSELELYGNFEDKESDFNTTFYVFYKKISKMGCIRFVNVDGKIS